jgi:hypothetical protein
LTTHIPDGRWRVRSDDIEVGYNSPGYAINFSIVVVIFLLHFFWFVSVLRRARNQFDHTGRVPRDGLTQKGYCRDRVGSGIKTLSILYVVWMQVSLLITIASNYRGQWPYSPGFSREVNARVTWDSFTRAFLLPWIGTFCILSFIRAWRDELTTFYMSPCALAAASHVRMVCVVPDESGNPVSSQGVLRVQKNEDGLLYVEWQLLRLVYSDADEAFTASPTAASEAEKEQAGVTGQWAVEKVRNGGLTAALAHKLIRGVQGRNEISIEVPSVLKGCIAEFYNMFYIYQFFAITISFYWDYVSVGLMFASLVIFCGIIKVRASMQAHAVPRAVCVCLDCSM